jgi:hypothetical protein
MRTGLHEDWVTRGLGLQEGWSYKRTAVPRALGYKEWGLGYGVHEDWCDQMTAASRGLGYTRTG